VPRGNYQSFEGSKRETVTDLFSDETVEARRLTFLSKVRHTDADNELKTARDFGLAWFACLQLEDKDPESELAQVFKALNDAWAASRDGKLQINALISRSHVGRLPQPSCKAGLPLDVSARRLQRLELGGLVLSFLHNISHDGLTALADIDILHHDALLSALPKLP
jgi:hypothetical protein